MYILKKVKFLVTAQFFDFLFAHILSTWISQKDLTLKLKRWSDCRQSHSGHQQIKFWISSLGNTEKSIHLHWGQIRVGLKACMPSMTPLLAEFPYVCHLVVGGKSPVELLLVHCLPQLVWCTHLQQTNKLPKILIIKDYSQNNFHLEFMTYVKTKSSLMYAWTPIIYWKLGLATESVLPWMDNERSTMSVKINHIVHDLKSQSICVEHRRGLFLSNQLSLSVGADFAWHLFERIARLITRLLVKK